MKKTIMLFTLITVLLLASCGNKPPQIDQTTDVANQTTKATVEATTEAPTDAQLVTIDGLNITIRNDGSGKDENKDGLKKVIAFRNENIGFSCEEGPFLLSLNKMQVVTATATNSDTASLFGIEKGKEFAIVVFDVDVENTSNEDMTWYVDQSTIVTDTKEQVTADIWFSDSVGGDFLGKVKKSGNIMFILKNSDAKDINMISWRIDSPHDAEYNHPVDDLNISINLAR